MGWDVVKMPTFEIDKSFLIMKKDKYIRFDWAVKRLLRDKANFDVLEGLLTVLLDRQICITNILENENNQRSYYEKFNRVNIVVRDNNGEIAVVELLVTRELHFREHLLYGFAKSIAGYIHRGELCSKVKKIYVINILYFDIGKGNDYLYHGQNTFTGVHTGDHLQVTVKERDALVQRLPSEIFPEYFLIRVNEFDKVATTPLEEWLDYLKNDYIRPDTTTPGLKEAREKLVYYNMPPTERAAYDRHVDAIMIQNDVLGTAKLEGRIEGRIEGRVEGKAEGLIEGEEKGVVKVARNMKKLGIPLDSIVLSTGLTIEEIERL